MFHVGNGGEGAGGGGWCKGQRLDNGDCHQYEGKDFGHHVISLMMVYVILTGMDICTLFFCFCAFVATVRYKEYCVDVLMNVDGLMG
jgi:hypothetical protein